MKSLNIAFLKIASIFILVVNSNLGLANDAIPTKTEPLKVRESLIEFKFDVDLDGGARNIIVEKVTLLDIVKSTSDDEQRKIHENTSRSAYRSFNKFRFDDNKWQKGLTYSILTLKDKSGKLIEQDKNMPLIDKKRLAKMRLQKIKKDSNSQELIERTNNSPPEIGFDDAYKQGFTGKLFDNFGVGRIQIGKTYDLNAPKTKYGLSFEEHLSYNPVRRVCERHSLTKLDKKARKLNLNFDRELDALYKKYKNNEPFERYSVTNGAENTALQVLADQKGKIINIHFTKTYKGNFVEQTIKDSFFAKYGRPVFNKGVRFFYGLTEKEAMNYSRDIFRWELFEPWYINQPEKVNQITQFSRVVFNVHSESALMTISIVQDIDLIRKTYYDTVKSCINEKTNLYKTKIKEKENNQKGFDF